MPRRVRTEIHPATPERWPDVERVFGPQGAYANCWCTFWRLKRSEFDAWAPERKRGLLRGLVEEGPAPGLLAYRGDEPVGWAALAPREAYGPLERSRTLKRVDDEPVWSLTCFVVKKEHRRTGVMAALLEGAARHAKAQGARVLEGYPIVAPQDGLKSYQGYMGLVPAFERAGFREVARPNARQRVMRKRLG